MRFYHAAACVFHFMSDWYNYLWPLKLLLFVWFFALIISRTASHQSAGDFMSRNSLLHILTFFFLLLLLLTRTKAVKYIYISYASITDQALSTPWQPVQANTNVSWSDSRPPMPQLIFISVIVWQPCCDARGVIFKGAFWLRLHALPLTSSPTPPVGCSPAAPERLPAHGGNSSIITTLSKENKWVEVFRANWSKRTGAVRGSRGDSPRGGSKSEMQRLIGFTWKNVFKENMFSRQL